MNLSKFYDIIFNKYSSEQLQEINLFGIRKENKNNLFDDWIGWFDLACNIGIYKGTTEPGLYWTLHPMRKEGAARLVTGFHKHLWMRGKHRGYDALVQANKCKVIRDPNKNMISDDNITQRGYFGINLHRASKYKIVQKVDRYSAGCQVIQDIIDFKILRGKAYQAKQEYYNYYLFDSNNIIKKAADMNIGEMIK